MFNRRDALFNIARFNRSPGVYIQTVTRELFTPEPTFNRMGFNQTPYNAKQLIATLGLYGEGTMTARAVAVIRVNAELSGVGSMKVLIITYIDASMSGTGSIDSSMVRARYAGAGMSGEGGLEALIQKYLVDYIEFLGQLQPGDTLTINTATKEIKLNEENALHLVRGNFWQLSPGDNLIIYEDTEASRDVAVVVKWRDKYI